MTNWPEGGSGARQQQFEGGRLIWTAAYQAVAFAETGDIYGDLDPGPEHYNFDQTMSNPPTYGYSQHVGTLSVC